MTFSFIIVYVCLSVCRYRWIRLRRDAYLWNLTSVIFPPKNMSVPNKIKKNIRQNQHTIRTKPTLTFKHHAIYCNKFLFKIQSEREYKKDVIKCKSVAKTNRGKKKIYRSNTEPRLNKNVVSLRSGEIAQTALCGRWNGAYPPYRLSVFVFKFTANI